MSRRLLFTLAILGFSINLNSQCWVPDFNYCYGDGLVNEVIFEVCDGANAVSAEIFQGELDGFDFLTVYDGTSGSGTGGTIVLTPTTGNLEGMSIGPSTAGNCLIFVLSSDGINSCSGAGSFKELHVFQNSLPTYDIDNYCYGDGQVNDQIGEICADPGNTIQIEICKGEYEPFFGDDFTIFEGASGSGTGGTIVFGPADGDLTGNIISTNNAGTCLILISNSGPGGASCGGGSPILDPLYAHTLQALPIGLFNFNGISEKEFNALSWKTSFETNNEIQILQKSLNGFSDWKDVKADQDFEINDDLKTYAVKDYELTPRAYYRLYSRDYDGFEQYSSRIVITRDDTPSKLNIISQFPNPAYDYTFIDLEYKERSDINVAVVSINGQVLRSTIHRMEEGRNNIEVNLSGLLAGTYYLNLSNEYVNETVKVVKL